MFKKTSLLFVAALAATTFVGTANAANILWVADSDAIDAGWNSLLTGAGHTVTEWSGNDLLSGAGEVAAVNAYDLVIISEDNYTNVDNARWQNEVTTPLIATNYYVTGDRFADIFGWVDPDNNENRQGNPTVVGNAADPIFNGIDTTGGVVAAFWTSNVRLHDEPVVAGGSVVLSDGTGGLGIIRLDAGTTTNEGHVLAGDRLFFAVPSNGSFDPGLTATGEQAFLNAVADFTVPEPSSLALLGLGGLLIARRRRG